MGFWRAWRERRLLARVAIADELWARLRQRLPILDGLTVAEDAWLREHCVLFLAEKRLTLLQGLELDEVGLAWDGDLVRDGAGWLARSFSGTRWTRTADPERRSNRLNAYRVLLTRARHRTIIWVPRGDVADATDGL